MYRANTLYKQLIQLPVILRYNHSSCLQACSVGCSCKYLWMENVRAWSSTVIDSLCTWPDTELEFMWRFVAWTLHAWTVETETIFLANCCKMLKHINQAVITWACMLLTSAARWEVLKQLTSSYAMKQCIIQVRKTLVSGRQRKLVPNFHACIEAYASDILSKWAASIFPFEKYSVTGVIHFSLTATKTWGATATDV